MAKEAGLLFDFENAKNKVYSINTSNTYTHYDYPDVNSVIKFVQNSINNIQETIIIQKDSSITDAGIGKLDIASANIFTSTTGPHLYKVGAATTTLYNGILYNGTVPFKNVTDDSLVRIQKDAIIYYAGGVAYCFTGEGIYSLLWDDTEKKGWVTKVKMDNESYYISYSQDSLPDITVTAGDFTWDATEKTLTATGAASTTKTATIKFNEDVSGLYFSLSNTSGTGRYGILSVKVNSEDYYIGHLQGLGTDYGQWEINKNDVLTIIYQGDSTSTADETFVFKIMHWQKAAETTSAGSYANYVNGMSQLSEQITTGRMQTDISNLQYDVRNSIPTKVSQLDNDSGYITRGDTFLSFASLDAFKAYIRSNEVPANSAKLFSLLINGAGTCAIVQKTTDAYLSFIFFGYSNIPTFWKYVNGSWSSQDL